MEIKAILKKFGLAEKEIEVYLSLLDLGPVVVSQIAQKTGINRSTAYVILDSLMKRSFVTSTEQRGVKVYAPLPPKKLAEQFEQIAKQYAQDAKAARELLSHIKTAAPSKKSEPRMRFFTGAEEMNEVFAEVVHSLETIRGEKSTAPQKKLIPGVNIYENKIVFLSPDAKSGVIIEGIEIVQTLKKAFGH